MTSIGRGEEILNIAFQNPKKSRSMRRDSRKDWTFPGLGSELKWYGTQSYPPGRKWESTVKQMVKRFQESGHPVFKNISASARGILKRKNNRDTTHFNADAPNTELKCRTGHSANQLSMYGAVAGWCEEFAQRTPDQKESVSE